jgi:hypothetical protein
VTFSKSEFFRLLARDFTANSVSAHTRHAIIDNNFNGPNVSNTQRSIDEVFLTCLSYFKREIEESDLGILGSSADSWIFSMPHGLILLR